MKSKILSVILAALATMILSDPSWAIDCTKAETKVEKLICSDENLNSADGELNSAYLNASSFLQGEKLNALKRSQKDWHKKFEEVAEWTDWKLLAEFKNRTNYLKKIEAENGNSIAQILAKKLLDQISGQEELKWSDQLIINLGFSLIIPKPIQVDTKSIFAALKAGGDGKDSLDEFNRILDGSRETNTFKFDFSNDGIDDVLVQISPDTGNGFECTNSYYFVGSAKPTRSYSHVPDLDDSSCGEEDMYHRAL